MEQKGRQLVPILNIDRLYTAFVQAYDGTFYFPGESHEMWELDAVLCGRSGITSGTEVYECGENELVIHPANIFHTAWASSEEGVNVLTISFTAEYAERYIPIGKFVLNEQEQTILSLLRGEIESGKKEGALYMLEKDRDGEQMVKNLLETLCLSLKRRRAEAEKPEKEEQAALFAEVAGYMQMRVEDAISVEDICVACGVGRTTLKNLFRRYAGTSVMKYYNHLRVRHAIALMNDGASMAEIALRMHFSSQNYFSDFFRREVGIPPSKYHKESIK